MENVGVSNWMCEQGWTEMYISGQIANPTSGPGALLFSVTAPKNLLLLRFTLFNTSSCTMEYVLQHYESGGWIEDARPTAAAKASTRFDTHYAVAAGEQIRVAAVANAEATGVSLIGVEYLSG
jgi:hypothetical protein